MPGCPNGATPTQLGKDTQQLLDVGSLASSVLTFFVTHRPTALAGLTASLVDINSLCTLNPDPPRQLDALDLVTSLSYVAGIPVINSPNLTEWLYEWLRYQAFTQFCVCNAPPLNPANNCLHATNITIPSGDQQIVPLGNVVVDQALYDSWLSSPNETQILFNSGKVSDQSSSQATNWTLQFGRTDGSWVGIINGAAIPEGSHADNNFSIQGPVSQFGTTLPMRILSRFGGSGHLTSLDFCLRPLVPLPPGPPDQPPITTAPTVPAPVCDNQTLCNVVQELSRQITRMAAQLSDVQARVGGTDVLTELRSFPISGEGQLDLALGTRAVSVELTQLGQGVFTSALGRPRGLMRAGSIRFGDGVGYSAREFIDADAFTRDRPEGALTVSWQLINQCSGTLRMLG